MSDSTCDECSKVHTLKDEPHNIDFDSKGVKFIYDNPEGYSFSDAPKISDGNNWVINLRDKE